jgi:hypothetical protein
MFWNLGTYPKGLMQRSETRLGELTLKTSTNLQPIVTTPAAAVSSGDGAKSIQAPQANGPAV